MAIPDWQLPPGVDRGLWDYLHSGEMVAGYDAQMAASPLARRDVTFCERAFPTPGRLLDLGCGTGRLCVHFARKGYECVGVDLSPEMLANAKVNADAAGVSVEWLAANLVELPGLPGASFDYAACLFSTLGMIHGEQHRDLALFMAYQVLKPGGRLVVHVHNRYFRRLGWRGLRSGDITMSQAYGGAPLTLHHFSRDEAVGLLTGAGFRVLRCEPVGESDEPLARPWLWGWRRAYGYLLEAERPA